MVQSVPRTVAMLALFGRTQKSSRPFQLLLLPKRLVPLTAGERKSLPNVKASPPPTRLHHSTRLGHPGDPASPAHPSQFCRSSAPPVPLNLGGPGPPTRYRPPRVLLAWNLDDTDHPDLPASVRPDHLM